ncbi:bifunctional folylpolyglutamate synthase/dihydrofolate synthase [Porcipelethomonas sp.]|uniref:bifunctional folylpolyglutamate synthase/dihydrofolate synthase n=1 Tax=Porcipelethomonas sp. TaxID=2981675 RepID=UPI003EF45834
MNFKDAMDYINSFSHTGARITDLSRIKKLLDLLGNPQNKLKFVHIAGTNGKGSVLEYCSNALIKSGYKTGQFTSPYILSYCDRIRINGCNIPESKVAQICSYVKDSVDNSPFSQFEITFAIALIYFLEEKCDIIFLETGIGGELDATNIINPPLTSVITSVSLDHVKLLGDTVEKIAVQKSGIIKKNSPVIVSYDNKESVIKIFAEKAADTQSKLIIPDSHKVNIVNMELTGTDFIYKNNCYHLKMCGKHQVTNAVTAIEILHVLEESRFFITPENIQKSLAETSVGSRIEVFDGNPMIIIDGGHNIAGIDSLVNALKLSGKKTFTGMVGMVEGKSHEYAVSRFSKIFDHVFCADGFIENNISAEYLAGLFKQNGCPAEYYDYKTAYTKALEYAGRHSEVLVVCGSLYLSSDVKRDCLG